MVIYLDANNLYGNNIVFDNIYGYWNIYDVILPKIGVFLENAHFPALIFACLRARTPRARHDFSGTVAPIRLKFWGMINTPIMYNLNL